jgi:hypothetical protein
MTAIDAAHAAAVNAALGYLELHASLSRRGVTVSSRSIGWVRGSASTIGRRGSGSAATPMPWW